MSPMKKNKKSIKMPMYNTVLISNHETALILELLREKFKEGKTKEQFNYYVVYRNLLRNVYLQAEEESEGEYPTN